MDVDLTSSGPPETILPPQEPHVLAALEAAEGDLDALRAVVADHPGSLEAWASLGEVTEAQQPGRVAAVEAYAYFRVGYHRGLDLLRRSGWKGSGYVRWDHFSNRGFLRCLDGLRRMAAVIGEAEEVDRTAEFLAMLDPAWSRRSK